MEMAMTVRQIETLCSQVENMKKWLAGNNSKIAGDVSSLLMRLKDIASTFSRLERKESLDDIELFEIKSFILISEKMRKLGETYSLPGLENYPDLSAPLILLDPERTETPHFFIYDAYDPRLPSLRKSMRSVSPDSPEAAALYAEASEIEEEVRRRLSQELYKYRKEMQECFGSLAKLDITIAKARYANAFGHCRPNIIEKGETVWKGLVNPYVADILQKSGKKFQPVDFSVPAEVTLVTGANMGGKSVLLKSLALAQAMVQFGFYAPAREAEVVPVRKIILCIGDGQDEGTGLSSFAYEMLRINEALAAAEECKETLILIDEPARTTNPDEGRALTEAMLEVFSETGVRTVVTSHYAGLHARKKFRVKGLKDDESRREINVAALSELMDYSLLADTGENPPREALRVARLIGVDNKLIERAAGILESQK